MHFTAAFRRHGATLAVVAGIAMFGGALGGLTGIDRRLAADVTSTAGPLTPPADGAPRPERVSDGPAGPDCGPDRGRGAGRREHSPHDRQEL
jgi:hypothetical protein